ncbi:MAG: bifunctional oligoribonuclease/PAP phosphatase NrnA [Bacteroidia bacterium]
MELQNEQTEEVKHLLKNAKRIFITSHANPDGDALGSSLALYHCFRKLGKEVMVASPNEWGDYLNWLPGCTEIRNYEKQKAEVVDFLKETEVIFCLDFNNLSRINEIGHHVRISKAKKILIDHHLEPQHFEDYAFWDPKASSTAELVYEFITAIEGPEAIDVTPGTCIYTGIMTDTGSFKFPTTTAKVHHIIARLIDLGVNNSEIHQRIYDTYSLNRLRLLGTALKDRMVVLPEYRTAYITIDQMDYETYDLKTGDTEGLVNFPLMLQDVVFSVLLKDKGDIIKMSFRSKGDFPADEIARKYFGGGGHRNAAGGRLHETLDKTVDKLVSLLPQYKTRLLQEVL